MAIAELSVVNNEIVIEVCGTALLTPLVSAAGAAATAAGTANACMGNGRSREAKRTRPVSM
jgi:hypothetical protein